MKHLIKFILGFTIIFTVITSCETHEFSEQPTNNQNEQQNITIELITLEDIDINLSSKITKKVSQIKKSSKKLNHEGKYEYDNDLEVYIDYDNGILVTDNGKMYYTFPMYRESEDKLENIIFCPVDNGELETYFAKYNVTPKDFLEMPPIDKENLTPELQKMIYEDPDIVCVDFTTTYSSMTTIYPNCDQPGIPHSNGIICEPVEDVNVTIHTISFCSWTAGGYVDVGENPSNNGNTTGGGTTGPSSGISTSPTISQGAILSLNLSNLLGITDINIQHWIQNKTNWNKAQAVYDFLENNDCGSVISSSTSTTDCTQINTIANEVLNTMIANGELTPLEAFEQFFSENLDLIVVDGPDIAIDDMEEYLDCFDTSAGAANAIITLSVDEPIENSTAVYSTIDGVGHTFITIEQGDNVASFGFYPLNSLPSLFTPVTGVMGDNSNTEFDVSLTIKNVSPSDLQLVIDHAINYANLEYDLHWNNCTDMGISITNLIGLSIPECNANPLIFFGTTPGRLGEYIRNLSSPLPNNVEKNESGGNSPNNNCN